MAVTHPDFMSAAKDIMAQGALSEIQLRSAANRAYYALYHAAKVQVHTMGIPIRRVDGAGSHEALIHTIRLSGHQGKSIAQDMERLKKLRHKCDYELNFPLEAPRVHAAIVSANRLIDRISRLDAG